MDKKKVTIIAVIAVVLLAFVVGYFILKNDSKIFNPGARAGVAADGSTYGINENETHNIAKLITKEQVERAFGDKAKSVKAVDESKAYEAGKPGSQTSQSTALYEVKLANDKPIIVKASVVVYPEGIDPKAQSFAGTTEKDVVEEVSKGARFYSNSKIARGTPNGALVGIVNIKGQKSFFIGVMYGVNEDDELPISDNDVKMISTKLAKDANYDAVE